MKRASSYEGIETASELNRRPSFLVRRITALLLVIDKEGVWLDESAAPETESVLLRTFATHACACVDFLGPR